MAILLVPIQHGYPVFLSPVIAEARASDTILDNSGGSGHHCPVLALSTSEYHVSCGSVIYEVCSFYIHIAKFLSYRDAEFF